MVSTMLGLSRGVSSGALAVAVSFLLACTVQSGAPVSYDEATGTILFAPIIALFALLWVTLASLIFGAPLVWLLAQLECDSAEVIAMLGAICGLGLLVGAVVAFGGTVATDLPFIFAATVGGGVTGAVWGMVRDEQRATGPTATSHPNRLHDDRILR